MALVELRVLFRDDTSTPTGIGAHEIAKDISRDYPLVDVRLEDEETGLVTFYRAGEDLGI